MGGKSLFAQISSFQKQSQKVHNTKIGYIYKNNNFTFFHEAVTISEKKLKVFKDLIILTF